MQKKSRINFRTISRPLKRFAFVFAVFAGTFCFSSPASSEDEIAPQPKFFEKFLPKALLEQKKQAEPPVCSGEDLTKKFSKEENRKFMERARKIKNGNARFWKVEKKGTKPSYLFGTMHVSDPAIVNLAPKVKTALENADRVALELSEAADDNGKAMAAKLAASPDFLTPKKGESFKDGLSQQEFNKLKASFETHNLPFDLISKNKPWFIWMTLSLPACEARREAYGYRALDVEIGQNAKKLGKPVLGLETVDEQLSAIEKLPLSFQANSIEDYLDNPKFYANMFYTEMQLYKQSRIGEILALDTMFKTTVSEKDQAIFKDILMTKRNLRMSERALPLIEQGNSFIAIGAAHMVDDSGLVEQLRKHGYRVSAIKL
ncbi:TraB/GumN family protein [Bartonella apihabitans]|uniref:TraB/GumN family protein n=1 Tax=uncultured Bartonella sp. TaxID=104108 RepID=UPI0025FE1368|nr:TraB/GumN family protein [Bartonella apihabitans]WLT08511.1 TraB/GumN family protein [Bartonella apihabitans]